MQSIASEIEIKVKVDFREDLSNLDKNEFLFSYEVSILNRSEHRVQLLHRFWEIFDSLGEHRQVEGPGVIGKQPILESGDSHRYSSWCPLRSDTGYMEGHYRFKDLDSNNHFRVAIPKFDLIPPYKQN